MSRRRGGRKSANIAMGVMPSATLWVKGFSNGGFCCCSGVGVVVVVVVVVIVAAAGVGGGF